MGRCVVRCWEGVVSLPLPASTGRIWAAVRAFVEDVSEALGSLPGDGIRSRIIPNRPRSAESEPSVLARSGERQVLPTHGWGKQSVWLATGSQTLFVGWRPHPLFAARGPKGREKKCAFLQGQNYDAVDKENTVPRRSEKTAPVWPCKPLCRANGGGAASVSPCRLSLAAVDGLCGNVPLSLIPSGSYECSDNSSHNPWLSRKCSGMVCFPAAPYQNFYVREEAETWRPEQETGSLPSE